jgi:membrane protein DedA with SNARE-associated domain
VFKESALLFEARYVSSLLLVFMGSMDCLTTVIGTTYFQTIELNPLMAGLVNSNLPAFVILKLTTTVFVGVIFFTAHKILFQSANHDSKSFRLAYSVLKVAFIGITVFLVIVVLNNIIVIARTI